MTMEKCANLKKKKKDFRMCLAYLIVSPLIRDSNLIAARWTSSAWLKHEKAEQRTEKKREGN